MGRVIWLLPRIPKLRTLINWVKSRFSLRDRWLNRIINKWKPDIIHSLPLDTGGKPVRRIREHYLGNQWPKWVVTSWGSDIYLGIDAPKTRRNIKSILQYCDGFIADCNRDLKLAIDNNLESSKLALPNAVPGSGGLKLKEFSKLRVAYRKRNLIIVPKAFDRFFANRILPTLEALRLVEDSLEGYEIHLFMCSNAVETWVRQIPESLQHRIHCHDMVPQTVFFEMLGRARVMVSPSLSDGTPNVMLEAMAAGALPLMSPLESIQEWIEDGRNGLLANALYPTQIAAAIGRSLSDHDLFQSAQKINWEIISKRANRTNIRKQVLGYYRSLIAG